VQGFSQVQTLEVPFLADRFPRLLCAEASLEFLRLLDEYLDWDEIIPEQFRHAYYSYTGRPHTYSLESMLAILQYSSSVSPFQ
jgi:hypothetical protein